MYSWGSRGMESFGNWLKATVSIGCQAETRRPRSLISSCPAGKRCCSRVSWGRGRGVSHLCSPIRQSEPPGRSPRHSARRKLLKREPAPFSDTCHISHQRERPTAAWIVHWGMSQSQWHMKDKKLPCHLPFTLQRDSPESVRRRITY